MALLACVNRVHACTCGHALSVPSSTLSPKPYATTQVRGGLAFAMLFIAQTAYAIITSMSHGMAALNYIVQALGRRRCNKRAEANRRSRASRLTHKSAS